MTGFIVNYGRGKRTARHHQMIVAFPSEKNPGGLVGRKVVWTSEGGKSIYGKLVALHGRKGALKAQFQKGLPGQAIGDSIALATKGIAEKHEKKAPAKAPHTKPKKVRKTAKKH